IQVAVDTAPFAAYLSSFTISAQGRHTVQWFARDNVNNAEITQSTTVVISTTLAPGTTLVMGSPQFVDASSRTILSGSTPLSFSVNDNGQGIAFTRYAVDQATFTNYTSVFNLSGGSHSLSFQSQDLLGTIEPLQSVTLYVDTVPPVSRLTLST